MNWDRLFSLQYERVVGQDHAIQFGSRPIPLPARKGGPSYAGQRVELAAGGETGKGGQQTTLLPQAAFV